MISFSVAFDPNKGIGLNGSLPWHIKEELKLFKANTMGHAIIMGRTTYEGLPRKLVGRKIVVVTRDSSYSVDDPDCMVVNDLEEYLKEHVNDDEEIIVCGGATIYKQSYQYASKAYVSFVKKEYETDTKFNEFNLDEWKVTSEVEYEEFIYRELERKN